MSTPGGARPPRRATAVAARRRGSAGHHARRGAVADRGIAHVSPHRRRAWAPPLLAALRGLAGARRRRLVGACTCGGATSATCRPATPSATRRRRARRCSTTCRCGPSTSTRCPRSDAGLERRRGGRASTPTSCAAASRPEDHAEVPVVRRVPARHRSRRPRREPVPAAARRCTRPSAASSGCTASPKPPPRAHLADLPRACTASREVWLLGGGRGQGRRRPPGALRRRPRAGARRGRARPRAHARPVDEAAAARAPRAAAHRQPLTSGSGRRPGSVADRAVVRSGLLARGAWRAPR